MDKYSIPLEENNFYHIYNQGNNGEKIFYNDENYAYFIIKFDKYLSEYLELYAYCLMQNHFHLLVRTKMIEELSKEAKEKFDIFRDGRFSKFLKLGKSGLSANDIFSEFISLQFRNFFISYSKSINKQTRRSGSLFRKNFKRKKIDSEQYLRQAVIYIHRNPLYHGIDTDFEHYRWSSYERILEEKLTKLKKKQVLEWFGDKENYNNTHNINVEDDID